MAAPPASAQQAGAEESAGRAGHALLCRHWLRACRSLDSCPECLGAPVGAGAPGTSSSGGGPVGDVYASPCVSHLLGGPRPDFRRCYRASSEAGGRGLLSDSATGALFRVVPVTGKTGSCTALQILLLPEICSRSSLDFARPAGFPRLSLSFLRGKWQSGFRPFSGNSLLFIRPFILLP